MASYPDQSPVLRSDSLPPPATVYFLCANGQAPLHRVSLAAPGPQKESRLSPARHTFPLRMLTLTATPPHAVMLLATSLLALGAIRSHSCLCWETMVPMLS